VCRPLPWLYPDFVLLELDRRARAGGDLVDLRLHRKRKCNAWRPRPPTLHGGRRLGSGDANNGTDNANNGADNANNGADNANNSTMDDGTRTPVPIDFVAEQQHSLAPIMRQTGKLHLYQVARLRNKRHELRLLRRRRLRAQTLRRIAS
jgi:hypothetical protein